MKERPKGFLSDELISHQGEQFDYIAELQAYLWRFVRVAYPHATGHVRNFVDNAIEKLESRPTLTQHDEAAAQKEFDALGEQLSENRREVWPDCKPIVGEIIDAIIRQPDSEPTEQTLAIIDQIFDDLTDRIEKIKE